MSPSVDSQLNTSSPKSAIQWAIAMNSWTIAVNSNEPMPRGAVGELALESFIGGDKLDRDAETADLGCAAVLRHDLPLTTYPNSTRRGDKSA